MALLLLAALPACSYHFPFDRGRTTSPLGRPVEESRENRPFAVTALNYATSLALTVAIHEGAHALAAHMMGGEDIDVGFFTDGRIGLTTYRGDFTVGERNFIDLAGPATNYALGEAGEYLLVHDEVPESWRPWLATFTLTSKADFAAQPFSGLASNEADFGAVADRSDFGSALWLVPLGAEVTAHHQLYLDLLRESVTVPVPRRAPDETPREGDGGEPPDDDRPGDGPDEPAPPHPEEPAPPPETPR